MGIPHGTHVKSNRMVPSLKSQVSNLLLLVCRLSPVACRLSPVACRLSPVASRVSRLASRLSSRPVESAGEALLMGRRGGDECRRERLEKRERQRLRRSR